MFYPAKQVPPYTLWIGSKRDSMNKGAARRHHIGLVVNCTRTIPFSLPDAVHYRVPVDDHPDDAAVMRAHLPRAVALIDRHVSNGEGVLVHCHAGISRSASVVAAFLMHKHGITAAQAVKRVKLLKPETFGGGYNFIAALRDFEGVIVPDLATTTTTRTTTKSGAKPRKRGKP